jgi:hypothetical protein
MTQVWSISNKGMRKFLRFAHADTDDTDNYVLDGSYIYTGRLLNDYEKELLIDDSTCYFVHEDARNLLVHYLGSSSYDYRFEKPLYKGELGLIGEAWLGKVSETIHALAHAGADRDQAGRFVLTGLAEPLEVATMTDILIPANSLFFLKGIPTPLAAYLRTTDQGVKISGY